jgi:catechol 2,3-dioxygenase-like lactoylglutathione lyase family enzyme
MDIRFHHVNFASKDVAAMDEFYRNVLGLEPEPALSGERIKSEGYPGAVSFLTDRNVQVHLAEKDLDVAFRTKHAINPVERGHIAFRTDDIEAFKKRLDEQGVRYADYGKWSMSGWYQIFFQDPDGNVIEMHQADE